LDARALFFTKERSKGKPPWKTFRTRQKPWDLSQQVARHHQDGEISNRLRTHPTRWWASLVKKAIAKVLLLITAFPHSSTFGTNTHFTFFFLSNPSFRQLPTRQSLLLPLICAVAERSILSSVLILQICYSYNCTH